MHHTIPHYWKTKRLMISDAIIEEADELQKVYEDGFKKDWIYSESKPIKSYIKNRINKPSLPPKGNKELQLFQTIRRKSDSKIIGYLALYHGWPKKDIVWIGDLFLLSSVQGQKLGRELVTGLIKEIKSLKRFKFIRCKVHLNNWPAIRFWARMEFDTIVGYSGNREHSKNNSADLILEIDLKEGKQRKRIWQNK